jgi:EAL domain-containing protein (putative c-di-GMP-specific phosphodiesterase class I)
VRLSVDDFGTGYSSLTYLQRLPVHEVKIDKSFVFQVASDEADATIVQSIVELGHNLGLSVVAEGVEDLVTWDRLRAMSCDIAQGYYLSKPLPPASLTRWLVEQQPAPVVAPVGAGSLLSA